MIESIFYLFSSMMVFFLLLPFVGLIIAQFFKKTIPEKTVHATDFACIITAYKNIEITQPLIDSLLKQNYSRFTIYLVADACNTALWEKEHPKLVLLKPEPALNLKAKSIIYAVERFERDHAYTVIFDADNLAHPNFLAVMNDYAKAGFKAIQGQRTAKNLDNIFACADATGEYYKNYVERYLPPILGSSAVISGSGMAVETTLYKSYLYGPEIQKGKDKWKKMLQEDKILQNHLLDRNEQIVFAKEAIVYDEKVSSAAAVETQRSRWLYSYFQNTGNALGLLRKGIFNLNFNQFWFGLITIAPPLFIQVITALLLSFIGLWINYYWSFLLLISLFLFFGNILLVLYLSSVPREIWNAVWGIPIFIFRQIAALFKMGNPNKHFKHSEHNKTVSVDELLKQRDKE